MRPPLKDIRSKLQSGDNKRLLANFASLSTLQATNFILPFVVIPYLVRIIGVGKFGLVAFAQALMAYFIVLTDYGFNLSATRNISVNRDNNERITEIFNSVYATRLLLGIVGFTILTSIVYFIPKFYVDLKLYMLSFFMVVGQLMLPSWFFLGIERMKFMTYLNVVSKCIYAILVFVLINQPADFIYVNVFLGIGNIISGIIALMIIGIKFKIHFKIPSLSMIRYQLINSWHIFISNLTISISLNSNLVILGFFANAQVVGYYSIAEKIFQLIRTGSVLVYQAIYPSVCLFASQSIDKLRHFLGNIVKIIYALFIPVCILTFVLAPQIVLLMSGKHIPESITLLRVLSFAPFFAVVNIPACQTMLAFNFNKSYALVTTLGATLNVIMNLVLAYYFLAMGAAITSLVTEIFFATALYMFLRKYHPEHSMLSVLNVFR